VPLVGLALIPWVIETRGRELTDWGANRVTARAAAAAPRDERPIPAPRPLC